MDDNAPLTRTELRTELAAALAVTEKHIDVTRAELRTELAASEKRIIEYVDERTRDLQTELLRAFADYSASNNIRFRKLEADVSNIDTSATQRLGELERQMADFKIRLIALEGHRPH